MTAFRCGVARVFPPSCTPLLHAATTAARGRRKDTSATNTAITSGGSSNSAWLRRANENLNGRADHPLFPFPISPEGGPVPRRRRYHGTTLDDVRSQRHVTCRATSQRKPWRSRHGEWVRLTFEIANRGAFPLISFIKVQHAGLRRCFVQGIFGESKHRENHLGVSCQSWVFTFQQSKTFVNNNSAYIYTL